MISASELFEAVPVIVSLIVIEGLLSVDNALAIAAMANHLPGKQKYLALRLGILGAYVFRGLALAVVTWIAENIWLNILGSAYLIYLMSSHLSRHEQGEHAQLRKRRSPGLVATVVQIELMDLSLSLDNVVAAVALAPKDAVTGDRELWVVYAGVFIGILALRVLAGYCIKLLQRFPILANTAFLLVGYVGFILLAELLSTFPFWPGEPVHVHSWQKFIGVVIITAVTLLYARRGVVYALLQPVVLIGFPLMRFFAALMDSLFWPLRMLLQGIALLFRPRKSPAEAQPGV